MPFWIAVIQSHPDDIGVLFAYIKDEGFYFSGSVQSTDWFIPSPVQGELLRLRNEFTDGVGAHILTVKQWVGTTDNGREREERERTIRPITFFVLLYIAKILTGFRLPSFAKKRDLYEGQLDGKKAVVSIDDATGLGSFSGPYLEIEVLAPKHSPSKSVQLAIIQLASSIAPKATEVHRSYQEMLEASAAQGRASASQIFT